jgi:[ribosomal protein S5]-alanine N-acetyltransferase
MRIEPTARWRNEIVELFPLTPDEVSDDYIGWLADPDVNRFLESRFAIQSHAAVAAYVAQLLNSENDLFLGIRDRKSGRHVGNLRLGPIDPNHRRAEIGIVIGDRRAWGRGIASAALTVLQGIAREELGLWKLAASCYAANEGSRRAFEKAGFGTEAVRPSDLLLDGEPHDLVLMGLLLE